MNLAVGCGGRADRRETEAALVDEWTENVRADAGGWRMTVGGGEKRREAEKMRKEMEMAAFGGGIIRRPRRPEGWIAPGPRPAVASPARLELWPGPGEDLCYLSGEWRILQRIGGHRWSLDDLVTGWFASGFIERPPRVAVDLGCGIGTVLLLVAWRFPDARCIGVEAQEESVALARRSLAWNGVEGRCEVRAGDLRDEAILAELRGKVDLVTGTPPYFRRGTGLESEIQQRARCRFEHLGGIEAYVGAAARLLAPGARFVVCEDARQRARVHAAAAAAGLAIERWRAVVPRQGKPPLFDVYSMRRVGDVAHTTEDEPLVVRDQAGRWTPAFRAVRAEMGMPA